MRLINNNNIHVLELCISYGQVDMYQIARLFIQLIIQVDQLYWMIHFNGGLIKLFIEREIRWVPLRNA